MRVKILVEKLLPLDNVFPVQIMQIMDVWSGGHKLHSQTKEVPVLKIQTSNKFKSFKHL